MTCTELEELSGAYVLDAITPEERETAEAHLAQCPHCTQLVKEMRATVEFLPLAVPQVTPAPQLKGRILAAVQAAADTSSQSTQDVQAVRPLQRPSLPPMRERPTAPRPVPIRRRATAAQRWAVPLVAAAAILFAVLSGGLLTWNISLQHQVASLHTNGITTTTYAIKGTTNGSDIVGEAKYISGDGVDVTIITVRGLPALQGQQVYQGWEIQGSQAKSVGLLNVQPDGTATINIPGNVKGNDAVAVSIEKGPRATPNAPKGQVVAKGTIA